MKIVVAKSIDKGIEIAKDEIYKRVDSKSVFFLSGGKTPTALYEVLAHEKILKPAAVGLIDERYGRPLHVHSNERMIADTGLLSYLDTLRIPFYPILRDNLSLENSAHEYDENVRKLFFHFPKSIGLLGIGEDGHTAGILPNRKAFINPLFSEGQKHLFVSSFIDSTNDYPRRVTLTFAGLSLLDFIIVFVFGKNKKNALVRSLTPGELEEVPARIYQTREMSKKTLIITDQKL